MRAILGKLETAPYLNLDMEGVRGSIPLPPTIKIKDLRSTSSFAIAAVSALCPHIQCRAGEVGAP